ncbi:MAG: bifunctional UDP-N-acetylglucosamine diphosphorylase/glucosamine-1-phosphate N-acetyltransferase GlmU [Acidobacteriota bacterium]
MNEHTHSPSAGGSSPPPIGPPRIAVVLAAGKGTRMGGDRPKVLHRAGGRALVSWAVQAARVAGCREILVVVGHGAEAVRQELTAAGDADDLRWVEQREQRGTGHALAQAEPLVASPATLLVMPGDAPLVTAATLDALARRVESGEAWGALAVADLAEPASLGRVLSLGGEGRQLDRIVEAADATAEELAVTTVNTGFYALPAPEIFDYLRRLGTDNAQGELYLTDAPGAARENGETVALHRLEDPSETLGVNRRSELAQVHRRLVDRKIESLMTAGVTVLEPARTVIEDSVEVGLDTVLHPGVHLLGRTVVGAGCEIHAGCWISDSALGDGVEALPYSVLDGARLENEVLVGPFARLRPGAHLAAGSRVGNFVEVKNARLGPGAKAGHLAYLGDAEVGAGANIGAGVVTCNYDGRAKHRTTIGDRAFVGSDTMLVAPVEVGPGATTAAGSVIHQDVPEGNLGVGRARQRNIPGWRERQARKANEED